MIIPKFSNNQKDCFITVKTRGNGPCVGIILSSDKNIFKAWVIPIKKFSPLLTSAGYDQLCKIFNVMKIKYPRKHSLGIVTFMKQRIISKLVGYFIGDWLYIFGMSIAV